MYNLKQMVKSEDAPELDVFPIECQSSQCLFCMGNEALPYLGIFRWSRPTKMRHHVEMCTSSSSSHMPRSLALIRLVRQKVWFWNTWSISKIEWFSNN